MRSGVLTFKAKSSISVLYISRVHPQNRKCGTYQSEFGGYVKSSTVMEQIEFTSSESTNPVSSTGDAEVSVREATQESALQPPVDGGSPVGGESSTESTERIRPRSVVSLIGGAVREVLQVVIPAILLALAIHIFLAQATIVYGQSMQPNLQPAERLVIEKVSYYYHQPERGDIVVLDLPQMPELLIKRVIGLPGEEIEIRRGVVSINGVPLDQPFVHLPGGATYGPITLAADFYFVMGDNRNNSNDSRVFGPVHRSAIAGKAWMRYWPLDRFAVFE